MKILLLSDIHSDVYVLDKMFSAKIKDIESYDLILCNGDLIDMFKVDSADWYDFFETVLEKIASLQKPILCVPGNHDPEGTELILKKKSMNLHRKLVRFGGFDFIGFGGAGSPLGSTNFEPTEIDIKKSIYRLAKKSTQPLVLVTHSPPLGTSVDVAFTGQHVGSFAIREFILSQKPLLALSAHIHESASIGKLGTTFLLNPGAVFEGRYGTIIIENKKQPLLKLGKI